MAHFALLVHSSGSFARPPSCPRAALGFLAFSCSSESSWRIALATFFVDTWVSPAFSALLVRRSGAFHALSPTCGFLVPPWFQWEVPRCRGPLVFWWRPTPDVQRVESEWVTLVLRETDFVGRVYFPVHKA